METLAMMGFQRVGDNSLFPMGCWGVLRLCRLSPFMIYTNYCEGGAALLSYLPPKNCPAPHSPVLSTPWVPQGVHFIIL